MTGSSLSAHSDKVRHKRTGAELEQRPCNVSLLSSRTFLPCTALSHSLICRSAALSQPLLRRRCCHGLVRGLFRGRAQHLAAGKEGSPKGCATKGGALIPALPVAHKNTISSVSSSSAQMISHPMPTEHMAHRVHCKNVCAIGTMLLEIANS